MLTTKAQLAKEILDRLRDHLSSLGTSPTKDQVERSVTECLSGSIGPAYEVDVKVDSNGDVVATISEVAKIYIWLEISAEGVKLKDTACTP